jgi:hypothetical protein
VRFRRSSSSGTEPPSGNFPIAFTLNRLWQHYDIDPNDPNVVWIGTGENNNQRSVSYGDGVYKSEDGGRTFARIGAATHGDHQAMWIDPANTNRILLGDDGGFQISYDAGRPVHVSLVCEVYTPNPRPMARSPATRLKSVEGKRVSSSVSEPFEGRRARITQSSVLTLTKPRSRRPLETRARPTRRRTSSSRLHRAACHVL